MKTGTHITLKTSTLF